MRPQYYYEPPRSSWLERLKQPPFRQILIVAGILLAVYLVFALPQYGARILILLIAFPIHELAHALTAYKLGDPTPKYDGRLTLNPFAHLDLFGSLLIMMAGLGWAKPVRFQPGNLRMDPRTGAMVVALAGPVSNLLLALLAAMAWNSLSPLLLVAGLPVSFNMERLLIFFVVINVALFFFNLIPLAPLDGFTVLRGLLPYELALQLDRIQRFSLIIFLLLFFLGSRLPVFDWLVWRPATTVARLMLAGY
ncbi:MAG: site-2 protease family protein [Chloroflexi bacterium]|nr:MAG: site-2 protease family protein [Chloroflexota bacterium]